MKRQGILLLFLTFFLTFQLKAEARVVPEIKDGKVFYVEKKINQVKEQVEKVKQIQKQISESPKIVAEQGEQYVGQIQGKIDQYYEQVQDYYQTINNSINNSISQVEDVLGSIEKLGKILKINIPLGGITSALGKIRETVSSLSGVFSVYGKVQEVFDKVNGVFDRIEQFKIPPDFFWKIPRQVVFKKKKVVLNSPSTVSVSQSSVPLPYEQILKVCSKNPSAYKECATVLNGKTIDYYGQVLGRDVEKPSQELGKEMEKEAEKFAVPSSSPELSGEGIINARLKYAEVASSPSKLLLPESLGGIPNPLKDKYKGLLVRQKYRLTYVKSLEARIKLHYAKLVKLKALVDQLCSVKTESLSALENCQMGGVSSLLFRGAPLKKPMETKGCCCGVCYKALFQARTNAHLITKGFFDTNLNIEKAKSEIVATISAQECATRNTLKMEVSALMDEEKAFACLQAKIALENLMVKIDQLETQAVLVSSMFSLLQNQENKKLETLLTDLRKSGIVP